MGDVVPGQSRPRSWDEPKSPDAIRTGKEHFGASGTGLLRAAPASDGPGAAPLEDRLDAARASRDQELEARLLLLLGAHHLRVGRFDWATEAFSEAVERWRELGEPGCAASASNDVAVALARAGDWANARERLSQLVERPEDEDPRTALRAANLAVLCAQAGELDAALDHLDRAFAAARAHDSDGLKALALNDAGVVLMLREEHDAAARLLDRASLLAQRVFDDLGRARVSNNAAIAHFHRGRQFDAIPFFEMALSLVEGSGDLPATIEILSNNVLAFEKQYLEPATPFREALGEAIRSGERSGNRAADAGAIAIPSSRAGLAEPAASAIEGDVFPAPRALFWMALETC